MAHALHARSMFSACSARQVAGLHDATTLLTYWLCISFLQYGKYMIVAHQEINTHTKIPDEEGRPLLPHAKATAEKCYSSRSRVTGLYSRLYVLTTINF